MARTLTLVADAWTAVLAPDIGGSVASLRLAGVPVLREMEAAAIEAGDVRRAAAYPMLPYANRIAGGVFEFDGRRRVLRPNFPNSPHPLHGVGWRRAWTVAGADERSAELTLSHGARGADALDWPFAFEARLAFGLSRGGLAVAFGLRNTGETPMPAGLGLHPFFPRQDDTRLAFHAAGAWTNDAEMIPSERVRGGAWDFACARRLGAEALDNDLFGWDGRAAITRPGLATTLTADAAFRHLRLFTPSGQDWFALEPVTHMADAVHRLDEPDHGLVILAPGEQLTGEVRIGAEILA